VVWEAIIVNSFTLDFLVESLFEFNANRLDTPTLNYK
jgi:hypothetical protein